MITEVMVREHLARLGENKAPGTDGMGSSFVKNLVRGIEMPLVLLFQRSLETGQVPEQWKLLSKMDRYGIDKGVVRWV